jgi:hypothetical protein
MTPQEAFMNWLMPNLLFGGVVCVIGLVVGIAVTIAVTIAALAARQRRVE